MRIIDYLLCVGIAKLWRISTEMLVVWAGDELHRLV